MDIKQLIKMAHQIEHFFSTDADRESTIKGVQNHIQRFWDPRMRQQITGHVAAGGEGLNPLCIEAVKRLSPISARWAGTKA